MRPNFRQRRPQSAEKTQGKKQSEFLDTAWGRCEQLLPEVHAAWRRFTGEGRHKHPTRPESLGPVYRKCLRNAMRLLSVEGLMPSPWSAAARRVLPASSPEVAGTALWGPVLSWCLLEILAEAIDGDNIKQTALDAVRSPAPAGAAGAGLPGHRSGGRGRLARGRASQGAADDRIGRREGTCCAANCGCRQVRFEQALPCGRGARG